MTHLRCLFSGAEGLDYVLGCGFLSRRLTPQTPFLVNGGPGEGKITIPLKFLVEDVRSDEQGDMSTYL